MLFQFCFLQNKVNPILKLHYFFLIFRALWCSMSFPRFRENNKENRTGRHHYDGQMYIYIKGLPISKGLLFWDTIHCWWPKTHLPIFDLHTTQSLPAYKRFQKSLLNSKGYVRSWIFSNKKNMIDRSSNCVCQYYQENDIRDAVYKIIKDLLLKNDWVPAKFHWLNKRRMH